MAKGGRYYRGKVREECVMQRAKTYLELIGERGKKDIPLERVYRQLFNRDLYLMAYGKIYRNNGAMTPGATEETADGMTLGKIDAIIASLRMKPIDGPQSGASTSRKRTRKRNAR